MAEDRAENREEHEQKMQSAYSPDTSTFDAPLTAGSTILAGRYRVLELLHRRPRLNLYLGRRLPRPDMTKEQLEAQESLVVIRELVLTGLTSQEQQMVTAAAFEEFVSPIMFGSPRLPGAGDRVRVEGERHYLVMQLRGAHSKESGSEPPTVAITLAELLLNRRQWPLWLEMETALRWGIQLCRIVARMHRLGLCIGDLNPNTVLVDEGGPADWSPVLLVSWPPAPYYWPVSSSQQHGYVPPCYQLFPVATTLSNSPFAAPETLQGVCDERSDVYSLGAIIYLLLTRYAPVTALRRLHATTDAALDAQYQNTADDSITRTDVEGIALIPPRLFNAGISSELEQIVQRALALSPSERYPTVFAMLEALEHVDMSQSDSEQGEQKVSPLEKMIRWVRPAPEK